MIKLNGKFTDAIIYSGEPEYKAIKTVQDLIDSPVSEGSQVRIMPDCLDEDTEILTNKGFKRIMDLTIDEKIANYDTNTKKVFYDFPKGIVKRELRTDEKVYSLKSDTLNCEIISTENHRNAYFNDMGIETKKLPTENKIKDFIWGSNKGVDTEDLIDDNELMMLAWILGDGNIRSYETVNKNNPPIRFGIKKERKIKRILELCEKLKITPSVNKTDKQTTIEMHSIDAKKFINIITKEKLMPFWFLELNNRQANILINELIKIDGDYENYIKGKGYHLNTKSKREADILTGLLSINYGSVNCKLVKKEGFGGKENLMYKITGCKLENLQFSKSGLHNGKVLKKEISYKKKNVVCVECESTFFIAKQGNRTFVTGNCHAGAGCVIGTTMTIKDKVCPNLTGVDLNCGVSVYELGKREIDNQVLEGLDNFINEKIPSGRAVREDSKIKFPKLKKLKCFKEIDFERAQNSIGTLGGKL